MQTANPAQVRGFQLRVTRHPVPPILSDVSTATSTSSHSPGASKPHASTLQPLRTPFPIESLAGLTQTLNLSSNSHVSRFRSSTYAAPTRRSNHYYMRNYLTIYQKRGIIPGELRLPALFGIPLLSAQPLCSPRRRLPLPRRGVICFFSSRTSLSRHSSHQYHSKDFTLPLFSYSYALFCDTQNAISIAFFIFHTLCTKHPGGGSPAVPPRIPRAPFLRSV
jgi:hypothetical protein